MLNKLQRISLPEEDNCFSILRKSLVSFAAKELEGKKSLFRRLAFDSFYRHNSEGQGKTSVS